MKSKDSVNQNLDKCSKKMRNKALKIKRKEFTEMHGHSPEQWLVLWRKGELPDTMENNFTYGDAISLEKNK